MRRLRKYRIVSAQTYDPLGETNAAFDMINHRLAGLIQPPQKAARLNRDGESVEFYHVDMRETVLDVSGQEIMTSDKVTWRMNAVITCRIVDALKSVSVVDDSKQALYREAQLALRAVIGTFDLATSG